MWHGLVSAVGLVDPETHWMQRLISSMRQIGQDASAALAGTCTLLAGASSESEETVASRLSAAGLKSPRARLPSIFERAVAGAGSTTRGTFGSRTALTAIPVFGTPTSDSAPQDRTLESLFPWSLD